MNNQLYRERRPDWMSIFRTAVNPASSKLFPLFMNNAS
jgi:hypothetical protein